MRCRGLTGFHRDDESSRIVKQSPGGFLSERRLISHKRCGGLVLPCTGRSIAMLSLISFPRPYCVPRPKVVHTAVVCLWLVFLIVFLMLKKHEFLTGF